MNLYIKQKIFSLTDRYNVYDEKENLYFDVDSEFLAMTSKLHLMDLGGNELFFIHRKFTFLMAEYEIFKGDHLCASIHQEFRFFVPKLTVTSDYGDFEIEGDFMGMDYTITRNGELLGSVHKKWMSWSDCYELTIPDEENAAFFCALVIAIDNCLHQKQG